MRKSAFRFAIDNTQIVLSGVRLCILKLFLSFYSIERHKAPPWLLMDICDFIGNETNLLGVEVDCEILFKFKSLLLT